MLRKFGLVAAAFLFVGASCPKPQPHPEPTPTPTPLPTPTPTPTPIVGCPVGIPPLDQYELKGHVHPANPDLWFWSITPKVNDRVYCAPDVVCPYGKEGTDERNRLEQACAYPDKVEGATMREDHTLTADSPTGAHVKFCHGEVCAEGDAK